MQYCLYSALKGLVVRKSGKDEFIAIGLIYSITFLVNVTFGLTVDFEGM
jgi:hypothetical protein